MFKISSKVNRIADDIVNSDGYSYVYDPEHKKRVPLGYHKTERGWSNNPSDLKEEPYSYGVGGPMMPPSST